MIEIENVEPTAREYRALTKGWGALHWAAVPPMVVFPIGFLIFGLLALGGEARRFPPSLMFGAFAVTLVIWLIAQRVLLEVTVRTLRSSPAGGRPWNWRIDAEGIVLDNRLQRAKFDWRGIKSVVEDKDRFLFLVTPNYNPVLPTRLLSEVQKTDLRALVAEVEASGRLGTGIEPAP